MNNICSAPACPIILDSTCVFYSGANLVYTGVNTNDNLQFVLEKIDNKFRDAGLGYVFTNGLIQTAPGQPVKLGGLLVENTTINSQGFTFGLSGTIGSNAFITTGGTSSQFVKGDGSLDSGPYQPSGNYITALTGDGTASGPGSSVLTLATVFNAPATYGSATRVPIITVNAKGLVTNVTTTVISVPSSSISINGDVFGFGNTGTLFNLTLQTVLATPGVYGSANAIPIINVNSKGLITSISQVAIGSGGTVTSVAVTPGTGISASVANPTTTPNITITNTAPDQVVVLNEGAGIDITGTYPSFTIAATGSGTVPTLQQVVNVGNGISNFNGIGNANIQSTNFTNGRTLLLNDNSAAAIKIVDNANASNYLQIDIDTLNIDGVSYNWSSIVNPPTSPLVALPFTTDHLATTNNQYVIGDVVYYVGNVYRCIANNASLQPNLAPQYWTLLGAGFPLVQQPSDWNSTSGNNQILNKPSLSTVYQNEIHVSKDGSDATGDGTLLKPYATITQGLNIVAGTRKTIVLHPGSYSESPNITVQYTVITTFGLLGGNTEIVGTVSTSTGCTISGIKMTNLTISNLTGTGNVNVLNCDISGTLSKSSTGDYTLIRFCDIGITSITSSAGTVAIFGGNPNFITVNNVGARVVVKNCTTIAPVLTAGSLSLVDCIIFAITGTSNALTAAAGTYTTLANSQLIVPTFTNFARVSIAGFYSIINTIYDRGLSTLTGTSTNSIVNSQFINADKFIKQGGTSSQFLKANGDVDNNTYLTTAVTSVGLSMPSAFTVTNSPITGTGTLTVTGAGLATQYVRGDGQLANFPSTSGGGSSVAYYLNGSVSQGTFGGDAYYQLSKTPVFGAGTDFTRTQGQGNGYIASFITDAGDPSLLNIPAGNWTLEFYFSASANGSNPRFYGELYKVDSLNVFTLIASESANPEFITNGTNVDQYFTSISVPQTTLLITDRIAIRVYVIPNARNITLHTENSNLSEVITTFSTGLTALNGLTAQVQNFATGTSGTDFGISSTSATHTFNLPDASATARGVITTGTQTIAGTKTFSSNIKIPSIGSQLILQVNSDGTVNGMTTTIYPSPTELSYVKGVTSSIQTQINSKQATITGAATTITSSDLTASRALISNASGKVAVSTVTDTELGYVSGVTSAIQTQIENKVDKLQVANTMLANNTGGGANMTAQAFFDPGSQTYVGTITWGAPASQPSGATNHSYRWTRIGNMVTLNISLVYATASSGTQINVTTTLPTDCPPPLEPPGLTAASNYMYPAYCNGGNLLTASQTQFSRGGLRNNAANNGYEIIMNFAGNTFIYYNVTLTYWTA